MSHEEVFHFPVTALDFPDDLFVIEHRKGEGYAAFLQFLVGGEIENEVIEQLVSCFRHGNVRQDIFFLFCHRVCYGAVGRSLQIVRRSGIPTACSGKTDNP